MVAPAPTLEVDGARGDVLGLPVWLLAEMPLPTTLTLTFGADAAAPDALLTTSRTRAQEAQGRGEVCCTPLEYEALCAALEADALWPAEARALLARKAEPMGYTLTLEELVGVARMANGRSIICPVEGHALLRVEGVRRVLAARGPKRWTFGNLCSALGAELVGVAVEGS